MKTIRGLYEMEHKKNIFIIIVAVAFCIIFSANIYNSVKSFKYRRLCNQYREQLIATENENRRLAETVGKCQRITESIGELCNRNVKSSRNIIELTEELRSKIKELEDCCGGFDYNEYYNYWDNEFGISQ